MRARTTVPPTTQNQTATAIEERGFNNERQAVDTWRNVNQHIYSKGNACTGGARAETPTAGLSATVTVASIYIRGLNDVKLELILQSFVAEEWDVLFIIDTQLGKKGGDYTGKKMNDVSAQVHEHMQTNAY